MTQETFDAQIKQGYTSDNEGHYLWQQRAKQY